MPFVRGELFFVCFVVVCCLLFVVWCWLLMSVVCDVFFVACVLTCVVLLLFVARECVLSDCGYVLVVVAFGWYALVLFVVCCYSLFVVVCCVLFVACC